MGILYQSSPKISLEPPIYIFQYGNIYRAMMDNFAKLKDFLATSDGNRMEGGNSPTPLAEHDKKFHPNGFRPGDKCAFRKAAAKLDIIDRLLAPNDTATTASASAGEIKNNPLCPRMTNPNKACDFGARIDRQTNLMLLLQALTLQNQSELEEKLANFIDSELSWCPLRKIISLTHSALIFGTSWDRFKLICQDHWIAVLAAHKCIFSLDETQLKNLFEVRERIVAALSDSTSDGTYLA